MVGRRTVQRTALLAVLAAGAASPPAGATDKDVAARVAESIAALDADRFETREKAQRTLVEIGRPAWQALQTAAESPLPEVRQRSRRILQMIEEGELTAGFQQLASQTDDAQIDLERGMVLIARIAELDVDGGKVKEQLDALADRVRQRLGPNIQPRTADPRRVVDAIRHVLFAEEKFAVVFGQDPAISRIDRVLAARQGYPIMISHVMVAVGDRLGVPLVGLSIPGHYMAKYDGRRAPAGFPAEDIVIDPADGSRLLTKVELRAFIEKRGWTFDEERLLAPCRHRATLLRMLNNIEPQFEVAGLWQQSRRAARCGWLLAQGDDDVEQ